MTVSFCGHRDIKNRAAVEAWLGTVADYLILLGCDIFLLGGSGAFDELAATVLIKCRNAGAPIRVCLVAAYPDQKPVADYDEVIYPGIETVPPRFAIIRRNEWMVGASDILAAYVEHSWGGAARMLEYAKRRQKTVILYPGVTPIGATVASF